MDAATRERISGWVADFCHGDGLRGRPEAVAEHAQSVLETWLVAACERAKAAPDELEQTELREALLHTVARLDLPAAVHGAMPGLCRDLLAEFEAQGRLEDGARMGSYLYAARPEYELAVAGKTEPLRRPGAKIGRNDPCPCGSGKKWKRCCGAG